MCLPHLEYARTAWNSTCKKGNLERMQVDAVYVITIIKGCGDIENTIKKLYLEIFERRRQRF